MTLIKSTNVCIIYLIILNLNFVYSSNLQKIKKLVSHKYKLKADNCYVKYQKSPDVKSNIESFFNLWFLSNEITLNYKGKNVIDFDISNCDFNNKKVYLDFSNNLLISFKLNGNQHIEKIDISGNDQLKEVNISSLNNLKILKLPKKIGKLNISDNESLSEIDFAGNDEINKMTIAGLPNLKTLKNFPKKIGELNISNNMISYKQFT